LQCGDGEVCAIRLTDDLREATGEVSLLFRASETAWASDLHVTDGPFIYRSQDGQLVMLWSSMGKRGYAMGLARSVSCSVLGPWVQDDQPIWGEDGGDGMVFRSFDGQLYLTLHTPNEKPKERAVFVPIDETGGPLSLTKSI
jgi:hypothetical protein